MGETKEQGEMEGQENRSDDSSVGLDQSESQNGNENVNVNVNVNVNQFSFLFFLVWNVCK